jgi:uncharacterized delta-60 repeat protein
VDGRVLIGGNFSQVNGVPRGALARLNADGSLDASFIDTQLSNDDDIEIRTVLIQEPDMALVGGDDPIGLVRVCLGPMAAPPAILSQPVSQTKFVGQTATFTVQAAGTPPLAYQWLFNDAPIPGATNVTLTLSNVQPDHSGSYAVVISNPLGAITSAVATLKVQVEALPTGDQSQPAVAGDGHNFLVVWTDARNRDRTDYDIYGARVSAEGMVLDPGSFPICTVTERQESPQVAFDGANYLVVWSDSRDVHEGALTTHIYGARVSPEGRVLDASGFRISNGRVNQNEPELAFNGVNYLVVWDDWREYETTICDIFGARVTPAGVVLDPDGLRICVAPFWQTWAHVAGVGGDFYVVWDDMGNIRGTLVGGSGAVVNPGGMLLGNATDEGQPAVAASQDQYLVTWHDSRFVQVGGGGYYSNSTVLGKRLSSQGAVLDAQPLKLRTVNNALYHSDVAGVGTRFWAVWQEGANYSGVSDVRGVFLGQDGAVSSVIEVSSATGEQMRPDVAGNLAGGGLVVWEDGRHAVGQGLAQHAIYGARLGPDGQVLDPAGILIGGVMKEAPLIVWPKPGDIVYGTPLGSAQLNATANVPGSFAYSPPKGSYLNAGPGQTLRVTFTPTDSTRYSPASAAVMINVLPASLTIRADDKTRFAGEPNPPLTATYTGFVRGETPACLDTPVILTTSASIDSPPVTYPIIASGATDVNYTITHINGVLTVLPAPILDPAPNDQDRPAVASDGTDFLVVWEDRRNAPTDWDIYGARVSATGQVLDRSGLVICRTNSWQVYPDISAGTSNYLAVWLDAREGNETNMMFRIYGARVSRSGELLEAPGGFKIASPYWWQGGPAVGFNGADFLVVWNEIVPPVPPHEMAVRAVRVSPAGVVRDPQPITIYRSGFIHGCDVAGLNGEFMVTWQDRNIMAARLSAEGVVSPPRVISTLTADYSWPSIAGFGTNYLVAHVSTRSAASNAWVEEIQGTLLARDGTPLRSEVIGPNGNAFVPEVGFIQDHPSVAADSSGFVVTWQSGNQYTNGGVRTALDNILGARVSREGVVLSRFPVCMVPQEQSYSALAWNGAHFLAVWQDARTAPETDYSLQGYYDVYGARLSSADKVLEAGGFLISSLVRQNPVLTWAAVSDIVYGTPLGRAQLNATANVPGTFLYSPPAGTVLNAGFNQVLAVRFTPADPVTYNMVEASVRISVLQAPLTIRADDKTKLQGAPNPPLTATYSGFVAGDTPTSLDAPVTLTTAATTSSPPGQYPIIASDASDANYTITYVNGILTVLPAQTGPGSVDLSFDPTAGGQRLGMAGSMSEDSYGSGVLVNAIAVQSDGRVLIGGDFVGVNEVPRLSIARLLADGSPDQSFDSTWGTDDDVSALAIQSDGKILIAGCFTRLKTQPRLGLARLNSDGSVDLRFNPHIGLKPHHGASMNLLLQPDGKILISGAFTNVNGEPRPGLARLNDDGSLDTTFEPAAVVVGEGRYVSHMALQTNGGLIVSGSFGPDQTLIRLNANGSQDTSFRAESPDSKRPISVSAIALQADGRILVGASHEEGLRRLNPDGSLDRSFKGPSMILGFVWKIVVQPDGRILIAGDFGKVDGVTRRSIARFNSDGSLDAIFDPGLAAGPDMHIYDWPDVRTLALLPDGHVLAGARAEGKLANEYGFFRLNADGTRDAQFNPCLHPGHVSAGRIVPLPDGKVLVTGDFRVISGVEQPWVARLNADGSLDPTFVLGPLAGVELSFLARYGDGRMLFSCQITNQAGGHYGMVRLFPNGRLDTAFASLSDNGSITTAAIQADAKIVIGGSFWCIDGVERHYLARLNPGGALDTSFVPAHLEVGDDWYITGVVVQSDGKIVVSGHIFDVPWQSYYGIARLNADGSLDTAFRSRARVDGPVFRMLLQPDDKVVINGSFGRVNGVCRPGLARLNADGTLDTSFNPVPALFDGPASFARTLALALDSKLFVATDKNVLRLNPDGSVDSVFQCQVGYGFWSGGLISALAVEAEGNVLISGGFRWVNGVPVPPLVRLRGDVMLVGPALGAQPRSRTRFAGQSVTLSVTASGTLPLSYQWLFNSSPIPGATNASLSLRNVQLSNAGAYTVVVSNAAGSITSTAAAFTVLPAPSGPGSLDFIFDTMAGGEMVGLASRGYDIDALVVQPDGKVVIAGDFLGCNGRLRRSVVRVHADGLLDELFNDRIGPDGPVRALALQADGQLLIGGTFSVFDTEPRGSLARLDRDGRLDAGFLAGVSLGAQKGTVYALAQQRDGRILIGGMFTAVNDVPRTNVARLHPDGRVDLDFTPVSGFDEQYGAVHALSVLPEGKLLVGGINGKQRRVLHRLNTDGSPDTSFANDLTGYWVRHLAVRSDGKIYAEGELDLGGVSSGNVIVRLNADGTRDRSFSPVKVSLMDLAMQPDDRIVIVGGFDTVQGVPRNWVARLNPDGSVDETFNPEEMANDWRQPHFSAVALGADGAVWLGGGLLLSDGTSDALIRLRSDGKLDEAYHANAGRVVIAGGEVHVKAIALQPDGRVFVGGKFDFFGTETRVNLVRLYPDGSLDYSFQPAWGGGLRVNALALQPDGKLVVGGAGSFLAPCGLSYAGLARLNPEGSVDASFTNYWSEWSMRIHCLALQTDGRILVGGEFEGGLVRFNPDGSFDTTFSPPLLPAYDGDAVHAIVVQTDGKVVVGGTSAIGLFRLNIDGSKDTSFVSGVHVGGAVTVLLLQPDGRIIVGLLAGFVTGNEGIESANLVRLHPDGRLDTSFDSTVEEAPSALALQPDGRILAAETVWMPGRDTRIYRLNPDGSLDAMFLARAARDIGPAAIAALVLQPDGQVLVGGDFSSVNGIPMSDLARLNGGLELMPFVQRHTPPAYLPGNKLAVRLHAIPAANVSVYAVEDQPPAGWVVTSISDGGVFDKHTGKVKFGPFFDNDQRILTYELTPPAGETGPRQFSGAASADGLNSPIVGACRIEQAVFHPSDNRPADWLITIAEVTAYGAAWQRGQTWALPPNPIPIDYVTRAAALWKGGELYEFEPSLAVPLCWVNCVGQASSLPVHGASLLRLEAFGGKMPPEPAGIGTCSTRQAPPVFVPGEPITVTITTTPSAEAKAYAVEDQFPATWTVSAISDEGELDAMNGKVKWGPFLDSNPRTLSYQVTPPASGSRIAAFTGVASFDGTSVAIGGTWQLRAGCRLTAVSQPRGDRFALTVGGELGRRYVIEASTDLITWTPLAVVTNTLGRVEFSDSARIIHKQQFYRATYND